jgi:phenylacetate-CoA ligase
MRFNLPRAKSLLSQLKRKPEKVWIERGRTKTLKLFHAMARSVPAYKQFLKYHDIKTEKIKKPEDLQSIPLTDKNNYLRKYPLPELCWNGKLAEQPFTYSVTSGSTGEPFYFPRTSYQDAQYALTAELYLLNNFNVDKKTTLYINGFAMGAWIGGLFTYSAIKMITERGAYPMNIITPGINKLEIIKAIKKLGQFYDQLIIGGYPPFIKDLVDEASGGKIRWQDYNVKFVFSAEAFSEKFRDYIRTKVGLKNIYKDTLNHYGTVDLGTMSYETPLSIYLRRLALKQRDIYTLLFGQTSKLPTLTQFLPEIFFFEEINGNLACSANSGLPLMRYDLKDHGGVFTFDYLVKKLKDQGLDLFKQINKASLNTTIWNLPFVYVYERSDLSVSLYGGNIYPETVRNVLLDKKFENLLTGKFTLLVKNDQKQNSFLEINLETKPGAKPTKTYSRLINNLIITKLIKENSEYRTLYDHMPNRMIPKIIFWPYEDKLYFGGGGKQKWVKQ